jgi:hypothetical protein
VAAVAFVAVLSGIELTERSPVPFGRSILRVEVLAAQAAEALVSTAGASRRSVSSSQ